MRERGNRGRCRKNKSDLMDPFHTKTFLEPRCQTRQPGRTWLLGPGARLATNLDARFVRDKGTNQTKEWTRGRKPASTKQ